jgi:hypothetical protein
MSEDIDTPSNEPAAENVNAEPAADLTGAENAAPADKFYIPAEDKTEEWNELYSRLGRPEAPDKYEISFREADKPFAATMQKAFFDNGLSQKAAAGLVKAWSEMQEEQAKVWDERSKAEMEAWQQAQGDGLAKNQELARRGAAALGLGEEAVGAMEAALGTGNFMDLCLKLGNALSEDTAKGLSGSMATKTEEMSTVDFLTEIFEKAKGMRNG